MIHPHDPDEQATRFHRLSWFLCGIWVMALLSPVVLLAKAILFP